MWIYSFPLLCLIPIAAGSYMFGYIFKRGRFDVPILLIIMFPVSFIAGGAAYLSLKDTSFGYSWMVPLIIIFCEGTAYFFYRWGKTTIPWNEHKKSQPNINK